MSENYNPALTHRMFLTVGNGVLLCFGLVAIIYLVLEVPSFENQAVLSILSLVVGSVINSFNLSQAWWFSSAKLASDVRQQVSQPTPSTQERAHEPKIPD